MGPLTIAIVYERLDMEHMLGSGMVGAAGISGLSVRAGSVYAHWTSTLPKTSLKTCI